jgi:hypothetical protein
MKGNITEPAFYTLQLKRLKLEIPFILENAEVTIAIKQRQYSKI